MTPIFGSNVPLWSLAYEFWYYIAFPLIAFGLLERRMLGRRILALAASAVILILCGKAISSYMLIWVMGVLVSRIPLRLTESKARYLSAVACIFFFAFVLIAVGKIMECVCLRPGHRWPLQQYSLAPVALSAAHRALTVSPGVVSVIGHVLYALLRAFPAPCAA